MVSIRETIAKAEANSKILKTVNKHSAHRPRPGDNLPSQNVGYSGDTTIRKSRDGSIYHGAKYGNEWYYRKYTKSGEDEWDITELIGVERIQSTIFNQSLYGGCGWGITKNDKNHFTLEIDNIIARKSMIIWELIINRLRASNGTFIVGSSAKLKSFERNSATSYDFEFENETENAPSQPFKAGDVIVSKRFWFNYQYGDVGVKGAMAEQQVATVASIGTSSNPLKITVTLDTSECYGNLTEGLEFVRVASSNAKRQGLVVLSSDGNEQDEEDTVGVPFIDVYGGLATYANFLSALDGDTDYVKVRMGKLDKLTGGTDEYGLWANVVHLVGSAVEGATAFHYGTRVQFNALTSTITDNYHDGDIYIITDEKNNIYTWYPDGIDVVGLPLTPFNNAQVFLTMGIEYTIKTYVAGDDFTGVGSANNNEGTVFRATGRYPTTTYEGDDWVASTLTQYWVDRTNESLLDYQDSILRMLEPHWLDNTKNKITILEKIEAYKVFQEITDSHTDFILEASTWGVSSTAYVNAYNVLDTYLNTTITWEDGKDDAGNPDRNWTTEVDGSLWTSKWQTLFNEIADLKSDISIQIDAQVYTDANGRLYKAPTTGTAGLFLGSTHLGYHNGAGVWTSYIDDNSNAVFGTITQRIRISGADGELKFYDTDSVERVLIDSSVGNDSRAGIYITDGRILVRPDEDPLYEASIQAFKSSISNSKNLFGVGAYLTTDSGIMPAYTGGTNVIGGRYITKVDGGSMDVTGIIANASGTSTGNVIGGIFSGKDWGIKTNTFWATNDVYFYGDMFLEKNQKLYFNINTSSPYITTTLHGTSPTDYYRMVFVDDNHALIGFEFQGLVHIASNLTISGTVDGVDVSAFKTDYDSHSHTFSDGSPTYFSLYKNGDLTVPTTATNLFYAHTEDYDSGNNCANGIFTAPANGYYHFDIAVVIDNIEDDANYYRIYLVANGKTYSSYEAVVHYASDESQYHTLTLSLDTYMASSSTAEVKIMRGGGTSGALAKSGRANSFFNGHRFV